MTLICDTCGKMIRDTAEENVYHNISPQPCDNGYGMCHDCVDWASHTVFDGHIKMVADNLSDKSRQKFLSMPFNKQCWIVLKLTENGTLTWAIGG
jgi:hypothetical protein